MLQHKMPANPSITGAFGQIVREFRKARHLTQTQLGQLSGLHRTYIADIERGTRNLSITNVYKIAIALDVTVSELCHGLEGPCSKVKRAKAN
jgi:transcriptional regulator with XRE-family HTH domain